MANQMLFLNFIYISVLFTTRVTSLEWESDKEQETLYRDIETQPENAASDQTQIKCDKRNDANLREGNIGERSNFPWLGVLRVYYYKKDQTKRIALTGLVLISYSHALVSAEDIAKIPQSSLSELAKAHFVITDSESMFAKPTMYSTHPEYGFGSDAAIALLHLDLVDELYHPIKPICLPNFRQKLPNHLYALGYTDENQLLEKTIHKLEHVDKPLCDEFYGSESNKTKSKKPVYYECGAARNTNLTCTWENGMIMASNATGHWTLLGFAFKGPNCKFPGRFLDISRYTSWIEASTMEVVEMSPQDYHQ